MDYKNRRRIQVVSVGFLVIFCLIVSKIFYIQNIKGSDYRANSLESRLVTQNLEGKRGKIYDRNGLEIVSNTKSKNVFVVPVTYQEDLKNGKANLDSDSKKIATILKMDRQKVKKTLIIKDAQFRYLKKSLTDKEVSDLQKLKIRAIGIEETAARSYPQQSLAANIVGFTSFDGNGLEGLESTYDTQLKGQKGVLIVETDRYGNKLPQKEHEYKKAVEGNSLVLTIDSYIQYIAEEQLKILAESTTNPKSAYIIVQNVKTGEILAMANYPTFNPEERGNTPADQRKNGAIQFNFEPGSIFKLITMSSALDSGAITMAERFNDNNGYINVSGKNIKNFNGRGLGNIGLFDAAANSNNVAMVTIGSKMGAEKFYEYIHKFGFSQKTNIGLYGEEKGLVKKVENVSRLDLATNSIGQSIMITPLQMVNATSSIVNGGNLMKPYLIKEIRNKEGKLVKEYKPQVVRQVISKEVSENMRKIMQYVVDDGSGHTAYVEGFNVGGKTGTAQKVDEGGRGYAKGKYVSSFVGVAPMNDPKYAIIVTVNEPQGYPYYGGTVAGPLAGNVLREIMLHNKEMVDTPKETTKSDESSKPVIEGSD